MMVEYSSGTGLQVTAVVRGDFSSSDTSHCFWLVPMLGLNDLGIKRCYSGRMFPFYQRAQQALATVTVSLKCCHKVASGSLQQACCCCNVTVVIFVAMFWPGAPTTIATSARIVDHGQL